MILPSKEESLILFEAIMIELWRENRYPIHKLFTKRELDTLYHIIVRGQTNREMAEEWIVSVKTIEAHRAHIRIKLSVATNQKMSSKDVMHYFTGRFWQVVGSRDTVRVIEDLLGQTFSPSVVGQLYDRYYIRDTIEF